MEKYDDQSSAALTRRQLLARGVTVAGVLGAASGGVLVPNEVLAAPVKQEPRARPAQTDVDSIGRAYTFLDFMMDAYATGSTLRLTQSYSDQQGLMSTAFVYDNAVQILAYLGAREAAPRLVRARILGDSFLYAQQHDPNYHDGRLRDAYFVAPSFIQPDGNVRLATAPFYFLGSSVGNMAWAGLALSHLYVRTYDRRYLDGAQKLGAWIVNNAYDNRGAGGYTGGVDAGNNKLMYKSTEHNIDVYAFFTILARLTGNTTYPGLSQPWSSLAQHALTFVQSMWNPDGGFFWTGTGNDGVTTNKSPIPEDVQTWSYLALRDQTYARSVDWAKSNLATTDTPQSIHSSLHGNQSFSGVTFSDVSRRSTGQPNQYAPPSDPDGVWFEGTAHLIDALLFRNGTDPLAAIPTDRELAYYLLRNIVSAQTQLGTGQTVGGKAIPNGLGVVAASSNIDTGFGFGYSPNLHIGATAWYLLAAQRFDPYTVSGS